MKKVIVRVLVCIYIIVAVFATFNLLTYNKQNLSEFNNKIFVKLKEDVENYKKGSLLIIDKSDNYIAGDNVFYCKLKKKNCNVNYGMIDTMMGGSPNIKSETISEKLIIGKDNNVRVIPLVGYVMTFLESRVGYLCVVVLPLLAGFIYELFNIIKEMKNKK